MRMPTSPEMQMAWHTNALLGILGDDVVRNPDEPQCGWFKVRLVRKGPFVPARIWLDQAVCPVSGELVDDERFLCEVAGAERDAGEQWLWLSANPIAEREWKYLVANSDWARDYAPDEPAANPRHAVDWLRVPTTDIWKAN